MVLSARDERRLLGLVCRAWDARGTDGSREITAQLAEWFELRRHIRKAELLERHRRDHVAWLVWLLRETDVSRTPTKLAA
jgi:hypothetical protein